MKTEPIEFACNDPEVLIWMTDEDCSRQEDAE